MQVEQIDRDAAAKVAVLAEMRELILAGKADHHAEPFARHRHQARAEIVGEIVAELRGMHHHHKWVLPEVADLIESKFGESNAVY